MYKRKSALIWHQHFIRPVAESLEQGHYMVFLVADLHLVQAGGLPVMQFRGYCCQYIPDMNGFDKIDGSVQRH